MTREEQVLTTWHLGEMKGAGTVGSIHLIQSILVLTWQQVYLSPDLGHVLFELTFIYLQKHPSISPNF